MTSFVCRQCLARPFKAAATLTSLSRNLGTRAVSRPSLSHSEFSASRHRASYSPVFRISPRYFQHLAQQPQKEDPSTAQPPRPPPHSTPALSIQPKAQAAAKQDLGGDAIHISQSEQRKRDWNIVKKLAENLWPKDDWKTRGRVVFGLGLLVGGKVRGVWNVWWDVFMERNGVSAAPERASASVVQASDRLVERGPRGGIHCVGRRWFAHLGM